jgi:hypothetical protein
LKGFTKSNIEHMIVEIGPPLKVRDVHGSILVSANNQPLGGSLFAIRDQSGTIRSATADKAGHFQIRGVSRREHATLKPQKMASNPSSAKLCCQHRLVEKH